MAFLCLEKIEFLGCNVRGMKFVGLVPVWVNLRRECPCGSFFDFDVT